ncbi:hypothetical protein [Gramella sp. KN1008]|uniref:TlpA family protein disulfide reductase n=1 Tax=Gramella sp. KN1008 TaxID=2529298 RepID=UPI0010392FCE|nr:hypothetical protein [Gramella sp. KN1008]TBW28474.1 hypothetical protein EZJ28_06975 [Gramella sp. KN1008]
MKHLFYFIFCCVLFFTSCKDNSVESTDIFLGGQINNPETDYVVLSRENQTIDTLFLDEENQFGKDFSNLESGIYTFKHPPESQVMYIEPGDSILIWLNTLAFDESLNFSGDGAEKSNFLLEMFLKNRKNNDYVINKYNISPSEFARISDSIREERLSRLEELNEKKEFSEDFISIARASINYEFYDLRERYAFLVNKYNRRFAKEIPEDFTYYRKDINFNNEEMQDYYVYTNLIDDYLRTKSIEYCKENHEDKRKCYNIHSFPNIERRILMIDSLSNIPSLKNEFIDRLAARAITMAESESRVDSILKILTQIDYTNIHKIEELAAFQRNFFVGNSLQNFTAYNTDGKRIKYGDVINGPTMTYAWSLYSHSHHRWQHNIMDQLKKKYPELNFMGINIDMGEQEKWRNTIESFGYEKENEFQIDKRDVSKETLKKYLNKIFFVASDGTIVRGDVQLGSPEFESELLEFLNK